MRASEVCVRSVGGHSWLVSGVMLLGWWAAQAVKCEAECGVCENDVRLAADIWRTGNDCS